MSVFDQPPLRDFADRSIRELLAEPRNLRDFLLDDWRRRESDLFFRIPFSTGREDDARPDILVVVLIEQRRYRR